MISTCPKCGAYYADLALAYCLDDGTPLVSVNPGSEKWSEGDRVVKQKEHTLRKQVRTLKWRRILMSAMTVSLVTIVVCVVALNGVFYFKPSVFPTPLPSPTPSPTPSGTPTPSPTPTQSPTPSPVVVYTISGRVLVSGRPRARIKLTLNGDKTNSTTTGANGSYIFSGLPAGGSYTIAPAEIGMNFTPTSRTFKNLAQHASTDFSAAIKDSPAGCLTERSEANAIITKYGFDWQPQAQISLNNNQINTPTGPRRAEVTLPRPKYDFAFKSCMSAVVTVKYVWKVGDRPGTPVRTTETTKRFACTKPARSWLCRQI